jgi:outer membrane protein TolC
MLFKSRFLSLAFIIATSGCMFHGNTPVAPAPEKFSVANSENPAKNLPDHPWWEEVGSTELNELVLEALENNKKVTIAVKNIETAQSSLDTIRLGWLPMINLMAGRVQGNSTVLLPNLPLPLSSTGGFAAFLPTWIVNIVQLPNMTREAQKKVEATASDYLALRTAISAQVVSSYAVLLSSIEEEQILNELKENLKIRLETTRSMLGRGLSSEVSLNEIDSEMQKLDAQIATNKSNRIAAKNALLTLVGRQINSFTPRDKFNALNLDHVAPGNTPTSVLATRPDVVAARAKIEAADYGISSTASLFAPVPTFSTANVRATSSANGTDSIAYGNMQSGLALWVLDPQFIGMINTKNKQYDASIIHYLDTVDNAMKEVDDALASFEANQTKLIREERSLSNSAKNLGTYNAMRRNGLLSQTQYLEGSARFDLARMAILQTKVQTVISLSKLYQSMGGGATYGDKNYSLKDQTLIGKDRETAKN